MKKNPRKAKADNRFVRVKGRRALRVMPGLETETGNVVTERTVAELARLVELGRRASNGGG